MTNIKYFFIGLADYILSVGKGDEPGPGVPIGPKPVENFVLRWIPHVAATLILLMGIALLLPATAPTIAQNLPETPPGSGMWFSVGLTVLILAAVLYKLSSKTFVFCKKMSSRGKAIVEGTRIPAWNRARK